VPGELVLIGAAGKDPPCPGRSDASRRGEMR